MPTSVLIVDDHPSFRRFARKLLEAAGYLVVGDAEDGASALAAVRELRPNVVLLDVLLPDESGFAVAQKLAAQPDGPQVVLTSSRPASDFGPRAETGDAAGFISKNDLSVQALSALVGDAT